MGFLGKEGTTYRKLVTVRSSLNYYIIVNSEDRGEDDLDTYWGIAFFENGELVVKDESPPVWWHQVENIFYAT